jgi:8-hydroxy-5-deazaflavin:NADPH oxidoreductase
VLLILTENKFNTTDMNTSKTTVAIIGLGNIGKTIASNLVKGNHPVILASRDSVKTKVLADQLGKLATAKEIADAIKDSEVIIPAIYFNSLKEFFQTYSNELDGKIIVDVSNPIAPDGNGGFKKIIGENESAGKILSDLIPKNTKLIKAFGTLGAGSLLNSAFNEPDKKVLFYASDSTNSNQQIEELITSSGFVPFNIGGIEQSIKIEVFGELHEFGALGKTVTLAEAKNKISHSL